MQIANDPEVMGSNPRTIYWMDESNLIAITIHKNKKLR
jgi:hypothetical protein